MKLAVNNHNNWLNNVLLRLHDCSTATGTKATRATLRPTSLQPLYTYTYTTNPITAAICSFRRCPSCCPYCSCCCCCCWFAASQLEPQMRRARRWWRSILAAVAIAAASGSSSGPATRPSGGATCYANSSHIAGPTRLRLATTSTTTVVFLWLILLLLLLLASSFCWRHTHARAPVGPRVCFSACCGTVFTLKGHHRKA